MGSRARRRRRRRAHSGARPLGERRASPELEDVAGADRDQDLARRKRLGPGRLAPARRRAARPTGLPSHPLGRGPGDPQAADAGQLADRLLARRVDVEHRDLVGERQRRAELLREGLGARVEVGLEDGDQPRRVQLAQGRERGADLGRVVGVVVVDCGPRRARPSARAAAARRGSRPAPRPRGRASNPASSIAASAARALSTLWLARGPPSVRDSGRAPGELGVRSHAWRLPSDQVGEAAVGGRSHTPSAGARNSREGPVQLGERAPAGVVVHLDIGDHRDLGVAAAGSWRRSRRPRRPPTPPPPAGVGRLAVVAEAGHLAADEEGRVGAESRAAPRPAIAVVVVLPWVPATAISRFSAQSSASSAPRWSTAAPRSRASASSGFSSPIAVETTTSAPSGRLAASWPTSGSSPARPQALHIRGVGAVAAGDRRAEPRRRPAPARSSRRRRSR